MKVRLLILTMLFLALNSYGQGHEEYFKSGKIKIDNQDYAGAVVDLTKAIESKGSTVEQLSVYLYLRGFAKRILEDYGGAINDFSKAINVLTKSTNAGPELLNAIYFQRGLCYLSSGERVLEALDDFNKAIEMNSSNGEFYAIRGLTKISNKDKEAGCLDLSRAGELGYDKAYEYIKDRCN